METELAGPAPQWLQHLGEQTWFSLGQRSRAGAGGMDMYEPSEGVATGELASPLTRAVWEIWPQWCKSRWADPAPHLSKAGELALVAWV